MAFLKSLDYYPDMSKKKTNYFLSFAVTHPLQCLCNYKKSVQILYFSSGHHRNAHTKVLLFASSENPYCDTVHLSTPSSSNLEGSILRTEQEILFHRTGIFLLAQI